MEGDYFELSQYLYNPHPFPYSSHQSPLGTTGFLTNGIRAIDPETSNCDQRKLLKKIQGMLNKALEEAKDISKKMKALAESNMAMKEELSRVQEDLENMSEEEFQLLEGTSEKFQVVESTKTVLDSEDANDSEDVADLEEFLDLKELVRKESSKSRYEELRKRRWSRSREREDRNKRSISPSTREESLGSRFIGLEVEHMDEHVLRQMGSIEEVVLKDHLGHIHVLGGNSGKCQGSNASIAFPYNEMYLANDGSLGFLRLEHVEGHQELSLETKLFTILSTQGKQRWQRNATFTRSTCQYDYYASICALQWECKEVNAPVHIGCCYNSLFDAEDNTEAQCGFLMSAGIKSAGFSDYATLFWAVVKCLEIFDVFDGQDALAYWISGRFPLMKVSFQATPCG